MPMAVDQSILGWGEEHTLWIKWGGAWVKRGRGFSDGNLMKAAFWFKGKRHAVMIKKKKRKK